MRGSTFDVAVDLRCQSPTFLHWHGEILSEDNCRPLLNPEGFAHGFQTLKEDGEVLYTHTEPYHPESKGAIHVRDPRLDIEWPLPVTGLSERDQTHPFITSTRGAADAGAMGIDIDIRPHNRKEIEEHPMYRRISLVQGSSVVPEVIGRIHAKVRGKQRVLICLHSNHTHDHVLAELKAYASMVTPGSYCIDSDTIVEDTAGLCPADRPWGKGDNPKTARWSFLKEHPEFVIDKSFPEMLQITVAPDGFLKRIR